MPARDLTRWKQNDDGTWTRRLPDGVAKPAASAQKAAEAMTELVEAGEDDGYESMTKPQLEAQLAARGLPRTGNKPELIERLQEADAV